MTVFTEGPRTAEYLISEANGHRSREIGTIAAGVVGALVAGSVLGKVTASGEYKLYDPAAADGSENVARILFEAGVAGDVRTMTARDSEVKASKLTWFAGATANQIATATAALAALGIIVR
ncbi:head decoration protein [Sinorhizobium meliloti]|uniref:head decoration protein n=1 Tax=Rhizobium meliloti TaxID=382 RepID=UPI000FDB2BC7|nr:head decoration protein [Sinorhizobium meliloti]MCM5689141.1 head decoration protein [Sinorhizobium meliloti]MCO6425445.1 head decoration protein [Sinorhizobium meliloti]RVM17658.1 head decoration protein [Sinorhizobium meliloti]RVO20512.1 head decoration protein [Sinorhizobium meliloti]